MQQDRIGLKLREQKNFFLFFFHKLQDEAFLSFFLLPNLTRNLKCQSKHYKVKRSFAVREKKLLGKAESEVGGCLNNLEVEFYSMFGTIYFYTYKHRQLDCELFSQCVFVLCSEFHETN